MLRSILNSAMRSRTGAGTTTRRGYGGGGLGGGYAGGTRGGGGGRNALMSAGLGLLSSRMRRR